MNMGNYFIYKEPGSNSPQSVLPTSQGDLKWQRMNYLVLPY